MSISTKRAGEIIDALRRGTVPRASLDAFCVGLEKFETAIDAELDSVAAGGGVFKVVRGDYGCGKTFFTRWLADRARKRGYVTSEVQISETETPLHKLETVYRRLMERLATASVTDGAFGSIVDGWFHILEEDVIAGGVAPDDAPVLLKRTDALLEGRLAGITTVAPQFS
ncbi:MAG: BREX system ATP-binding protein BrxD, partial [Planctomycetaceae bacterium]|nr:BREX system ATP-binding protein BrxD [Planctomycetaceae bacterium]